MKHFFKRILLLSFLLVIISSQSLGTVSGTADDQEETLTKSFVMKGWLKLFTYTPSFYASSVPNKFEFNPAYAAQFAYGRKPTFDDKDKDQWGFFNVPDDTHFFLILTQKTLYVLSARRNDIAKTYKSLELQWIEPVITGDQTSGYKGGLEDIGNFKEGFCFKLSSKTFVIWNVCADTMDQKERWMKEIAAVLQSSASNYKGSGASMVLSQTVKIPFELTAGPSPLPEVGPPPLAARAGAKVNGRWVVLQDWSQCSQACGGGKQFLQRMCVPPQNGGENCDGETLLVKECNTNPCPNVIASETETSANPTTIKMQKLSSRPLRYETCVIREGDLDLGLEGQGFAMMPKFPVRVILNNKTLSIFTMPSYDNVYRSWDLNYLNIKSAAEEPRACMYITDMRDSTKKATLCIMPTALQEGESIEKAKQSWVNDIFFFRDKCKDTNKFVEDSPEIIKKRVQVDIEAKQEKYERIKEKENENNQKVVEAKAQENAKVALQAVEKESKFEQLAMEEELMRERDEEGKLNRAIEDEEEKKKCLEREIKKKAKMKEMERQNLEIAEQANNIKKDAALQIQNARVQFKQRMEKMKRAAERKRKEAKKQLMEVRTSMAEIVVNDNKMGDISQCNPTKTEEERKLYCSKQFENEPDKMKDCMLSCNDYCYVCCENEFGRNKQEYRDKCYKLCDNVENSLDPKGEGFWTYVPKENQALIEKNNKA